MSEEIVVAIIALFGTMLGTFGGIVTSSKLTNYRISELEKRFDKMDATTEQIPVLENRISVCEHRIEDLERND